MTLYLDATTNTPDLVIDFIEVQLNTGEIVSLNWDCSGIDRSDTGFSAKYSGVYFNEVYANGRLNDLKDMVIMNIQLYTEINEDEHVDFSIDSIEIWDQDNWLSFPVIQYDKSFQIYYE